MHDKPLHGQGMKTGGYPNPDVPADQAWKQMQELMQAHPPAEGGVARKTVLRKMFAYGSAALVVGTVLFFLMQNTGKTLPAKKTSHSSQARPVRVILPDSLIAFLNSHSRLVLTEDAHRNVVAQLYGSVYFDALASTGAVGPITAGRLKIFPSKAAFYITYDSSLDLSTIDVSAGMVALNTSNTSYQLQAGESLSYHGKTGEIGTRQKTDVNQYSYATLVFEFSDTPLSEALSTLENAYGFRILMGNEKMKKCRITTRFDHKSMKEVLDIMAYTLNFSYTIDEPARTVSLKGEGCE